jgi:hypothetical protein
MMTLKQACQPRASVFDSNKRDTVHDILDLVNGKIDPKEFFAENYITQGMKTLLTEAFKRLEGHGKQAQGIFRLSQSMGGGKTHNLIALGLLAKHPEWRDQVMSAFYEGRSSDKIRVVAFSGRQTDAPYGIWGEIAGQLGKQSEFQRYYSPLSAPGQEAWINLLKGEPLIVMLDELPPYFAYAKSVAVGNSDLSVVTTAALSNLFVAVADNKLANVVLVLTDLSGASYLQGQARIDELLKRVDSLGALQDLNQEATRLSWTIDPVRMNTDEFYHILRTRLFEKLPSDQDITEVAAAYAQAIKGAKLMDITSASPEQFCADIENAYPFHPSIRDLYARFKENQGFQQTRALIRIMRIIVADLWRSGKADRIQLIGAHNLNLSDGEMVSEIKQINSKLDNAIAHDVASQGSSVAELIDGSESTDAQDVCKLVFLSSLSTSTNQIVGLSRSEIIQYLAAPGRDVARINRDVIDKLQTSAWYMHANRDGRLYFKDVQNINAKLDSYMRSMLMEGKEKELKKQLAAIFSPGKKDCYQKLLSLPAIDEIDLTQDDVTLVVFRPTDTSLQTITDFYNQANFKNRVCFLTGDGKTYERVLEAASGLKAIDAIIDEMKQEGKPDSDPQMQEATELQTRLRSKLYLAVKSTFLTLFYPSSSGLTKQEMDLEYTENKFLAEDQIMETLKSCYKYTLEVGPETGFKNKIETRLWPESSQEVPWSQIKLRAAQTPGWVWHVPNALDNIKTILVQRDLWRESGGYVDKGPFPQPKTDVRIQPMHRDDETGVVTLKVSAIHGDRIYMEVGAPATTASKLLDSQEVKTDEREVSFLAVDSTGVHEAGDPVTWTNTITLKHRFFQDGDLVRCELKAAPAAPIKYTTDGSNALSNGGTYTGPFVVPPGSRFVLAVADGGKSAQEQYSVPAEPEKVEIDPSKPYVWHRRFQKDATMETYEFIGLCRKYDAYLGGAQMAISHQRRWAELSLDADMHHEAGAIEVALEAIKGFVPNGQVALTVQSLNFESGQQLLDMVADLKTSLKQDEAKVVEVKQ